MLTLNVGVMCLVIEDLVGLSKVILNQGLVLSAFNAGYQLLLAEAINHTNHLSLGISHPIKLTLHVGLYSIKLLAQLEIELLGVFFFQLIFVPQYLLRNLTHLRQLADLLQNIEGNISIWSFIRVPGDEFLQRYLGIYSLIFFGDFLSFLGLKTIEIFLLLLILV